jgi:hypothetical protein
MCLGVSVDDERQVVARVQVGLEGEALHLYSANGVHAVNWTSRDNLITYQPLVWYQV